MEKPVKLSYKYVEEGIALSLNVAPQLLKFSRLSEEPTRWRHSCKKSGVVETKPVIVQLDGGQLSYLACPHCGRVLYYLDRW